VTGPDNLLSVSPKKKNQPLQFCKTKRFWKSTENNENVFNTTKVTVQSKNGLDCKFMFCVFTLTENKIK
jgi:hypothetical protein